MNLYVVYDRVAEESGPIYEAVNDGVALRQFRRLQEKMQTDPSEHWLMHIGYYDNKKNTVTGCAARQVVVAPTPGLELVEKEAKG